MARISRRKLLKLSGAGTLAARAGGIAAILASGRAPAYAQVTTLHWLRWNDFVPISDEVLRQEIAPACEKALGIKLNIEMINGNDIQARITSAIQSGSGPDIICALNNWPQLYPESVSDVSDLAEEIGKAQGGFYDESRVVANDGTRWIAVPWCVIGSQLTYRKSWFEEIGYSGASSRKPGRNTARPARSSRPRAVRWARPSATPSATRRPTPTPIHGRSAARRSRPTARLSC